MGVGAGLYMYVVVVQKFTFAISSPDEFLFFFRKKLSRLEHVLFLKVPFASYFRKRLSKENLLVCHYLMLSDGCPVCPVCL